MQKMQHFIYKLQTCITNKSFFIFKFEKIQVQKLSKHIAKISSSKGLLKTLRKFACSNTTDTLFCSQMKIVFQAKM